MQIIAYLIHILSAEIYRCTVTNYADRFIFPNPILSSEPGNRIITDIMSLRNRDKAC